MNTATTLTGGKHGTKLAGAITVASAILSGIDPSVLPPSYLPYIAGLMGLLTIARGFVNTSNQQP